MMQCLSQVYQKTNHPKIEKVEDSWGKAETIKICNKLSTSPLKSNIFNQDPFRCVNVMKLGLIPM